MLIRAEVVNGSSVAVVEIFGCVVEDGEYETEVWKRLLSLGMEGCCN